MCRLVRRLWHFWVIMRLIGSSGMDPLISDSVRITRLIAGSQPCIYLAARAVNRISSLTFHTRLQDNLAMIFNVWNYEHKPKYNNILFQTTIPDIERWCLVLYSSNSVSSWKSWCLWTFHVCVWFCALAV